MKLYTSMLHTWKLTFEASLNRILAIAWAVLCYLLEPDAAFMSVMILVALDLVSKLTAISVKRGGFLAAVKIGELSSRRAFVGTCVKLVAYFSLGVIAVQVRYVAISEAAVTLSKTVVYSFLFLVEAISIVENLVDAGLGSLQPLLHSLRVHKVSRETDL